MDMYLELMLSRCKGNKEWMSCIQAKPLQSFERIQSTDMCIELDEPRSRIVFTQRSTSETRELLKQELEHLRRSCICEINMSQVSMPH